MHLSSSAFLPFLPRKKCSFSCQLPVDTVVAAADARSIIMISRIWNQPDHHDQHCCFVYIEFFFQRQHKVPPIPTPKWRRMMEKIELNLTEPPATTTTINIKSNIEGKKRFMQHQQNFTN